MKKTGRVFSVFADMRERERERENDEAYVKWSMRDRRSDTNLDGDNYQRRRSHPKQNREKRFLEA